MRAFIILFFLTILFSCKESSMEAVSMKDDVYILADDSFNGRKTGTEGERQAAEYIEQRFKDIGLKPKGYEGSYLQKFTFRPSTNPHQEAEFTGLKTDSTQTGSNILGYIDNNAETTVIIGAHYDHLGMGGEGSLYREGEAIHNGADDNASGVAMLLHLAEKLQKKNTNNNYLFMAFSGEEEGLLGSNYFVKNPTIDTKKVSYMINLDMVGRLNDENTLAVHGLGTSPVFKQVVLAHKDSLSISQHDSGIGPSDHTSFYLADIPVLFFFTGQHEDYHKPSDDADKLNYKGMEEISEFIFNIITDLDDNGKLAFRKTKNESEAVPDFKVTLGVVPDYLFTGKGMRIDGISEDRPAQHAGMQKGDIVKKMGEHEVVDMMSYMKSLSMFEKGQTTTVTIERNGEMMEVEVTF